MKISQLCAANYHYKRYTLDYFLDSANRLGFQSVELWASGPHLHLEDFDGGRLRELNRTIKDHHLKIACFTPEQCVYPVSYTHLTTISIKDGLGNQLTETEISKPFEDVYKRQLTPSMPELICGENSVSLSAKELELMSLLIQNSSQYLPKETILLKVWGYDANVNSNSVEAYISFLRKKLSLLGSCVSISVMRNIGYKLGMSL